MESKSVFITGGASGIGRATAQLFVEKGWSVGLLDVDESALAKTISELGENAKGFPGSVNNHTDVFTALQSFAGSKHNKLDLLINNAGILRTGELWEMEFEENEAIVQTNFIGLMRVTKLAFPYLKNNGNSTIINLASISSEAGVPRFDAYAATKAAIKSLSETWWLTMKKHGIRVCDVLPHAVDTKMTVENAENLGVRKPSDVKLSPEDVARAIWKAYKGNALHYPVGIDAKMLVFMSRILPKKLLLRIIASRMSYK